MKRFSLQFASLALVLGIAAASIHCGGDGGGGGNGSSNIAGNVSSVSTADSRSSRGSRLVQLAAELVGFARKAYAQVVGLEDVEVSAGRGTDLTGSDGNFDIDAPSGDVTVHFQKDDCEGDVVLTDVADGSNLDLEDVDLDCDSARPDRIAESFEAVVRNKPGSPNGNLSVCVDIGTGFRNRVVKLQGATFSGGTFDDLEEGDSVGVTGIREGQGAPSALDADTITLLGPSGGDPCDGPVPPTATPEVTGTPGPTNTPGETNTPEPTATPTPTATPAP